jgi:hypothetical protein
VLLSASVWFQRLILKCDALLSIVAVNFNLRRCIVAWQAMPVLCHFIISPRGQRLLRGARVLELGAGIGVPGLLAGRVCKELTLAGRCSLTPGESRVDRAWFTLFKSML